MCAHLHYEASHVAHITSDTTLLSRSSSPSTGTKVKISYSETTDFDEKLATEFVNATSARPTEMSKKISWMLERLVPIKGMIDALAEVNQGSQDPSHRPADVACY